MSNNNTKERIIRILEKKSATQKDLSEKLGLSRATICEHIHGLIEMGYVKQEWIHATRYKYYELV